MGEREARRILEPIWCTVDNLGHHRKRLQRARADTRRQQQLGKIGRPALRTWAERLHEWRREGEVYAYFNNDWLSIKSRKPLAVDNALLLKRLLARLKASESGER